jgi:penicillin-binding protein 1A
MLRGAQDPAARRLTGASLACSMATRSSDLLRRLREGARVPEIRRPATRSDGGRGRRIPQPETARGWNGNGRPRLKKLRVALVLLGLSVLALVSWVFGIMMAVAQDLPSLENREQYRNAKNSVIYDRNGVELATLTGNQQRILIPSEDISLNMKQAVVAIEDQRFYEHRGVDYIGIGRALVQDVLSQSAAQGGSTITQQFVKNALRAQDSRTVLQKLRESALAYQLEREWSKEKILTEYLNSIYFGEGAYGIESAARTFFGYNHEGCGGEEKRCAAELELHEAALLSGMISSPTAYSPRTNPEAATARRNLVLTKMVEQGVIGEEEAQLAASQPVPLPKEINPPEEDSVSPYFTTWLRQQVVDRYGAGEAFGGGLQIQSSIDLEFQQAVESAISSRLSAIEPTGSAVVIDNSTGGVLAMVGGFDFEREPFNLATNGQRQPGSSFKPFTLATALQEGHSTSEVFTSAPQDIPFEAKIPAKDGGMKVVNEVFEVNNYEDQYLGSASLATATTYSDNAVYSQLGTQVGPDNVADTANLMGIQTDLSTETQYSIDGGSFEPYNPALILGGLETGVTPLEMAYAYSTLGRSGARIGGTMDSEPGKDLGPVGILEVHEAPEDEGDDPLDTDLVGDKTGSSGENEVQTEQVLNETAADTAVDVLTTVVSSGTGKNAATGDFAWGKTGTTDDNGDAWFCGGTEEITACVWVGHRDSVTPMETEFAGAPVDGGTFPALIWHDIVTAYDSIIGADEKKSDKETTTAAPTAPAAPAPAPTEEVAPAPEEPVAPVEEAPPAPAAPPAGGAPADGGTGTGAATP